MGLHKGQTNGGSFKKGQKPWFIVNGKPHPQAGKKQDKEWIAKRKASYKKHLKEKGGMSKEWRENLSRGHVGVQAMEKHPNWRGGKSFEPYGLKFNKKLKEQVRKRDGRTCRECNYTQKQLGYKLSIHHIDYDKRNNILENLIALCKLCHTKTNWGRIDWEKHFKEVICE